ncbi:MAG: hypothetical protein GPJ54_06655 [Candidatus Heimdallarchaeota archaeon]|nr:hypothetical protein [Candidatus Heimdallarchaeota archaeon]
MYYPFINCDVDIRPHLYSNIVLSGGSTMFPGLEERLSKELISLILEGVEVKVVAPPERRYSVWIGGSILASLKTFGKLWVTSGNQERIIRLSSKSSLHMYLRSNTNKVKSN